MSLEYNTSSSNMKLKKKKKSFINCQWRKEMYLQSYGTRHMVKDHSVSEKWTHCHHYMGNLSNYQQGFLYAPSDRIVHNTVCYTSCGALAWTRNSSMGQPWRIDQTTHCTTSRHSTMELPLVPKLSAFQINKSSTKPQNHSDDAMLVYFITLIHQCFDRCSKCIPHICQ